MTCKEQDRLWMNLSDKRKEEYKTMYLQSDDREKLSLLEDIFGRHNMCTITYEDVLDRVSDHLSERYTAKIQAITMLMAVAKFLNGKWVPDWEDREQLKYFLMADIDSVEVESTCHWNSAVVYFHTASLAKKAVEILGEHTIRTALDTSY